MGTLANSSDSGGCRTELGYVIAGGKKTVDISWSIETWLIFYSAFAIGGFICLAVIICYLLKHEHFHCIVVTSIVIDVAFVFVGVAMLIIITWMYTEFGEYEDQVSTTSLLYAMICALGTLFLAIFGIVAL
eukprot:SAG31_NODE_18358_length_639_cov_0.881481_1_plen_130_part_01